jgi:VIT1/CCC1 family predicted Fe2+/Mn2+ transporter
MKRANVHISSIVLGLNDALIELTGVLAGLTFAFQNTWLIAVTGSITGIAASLSMAASEYLSISEEEGVKNPLEASIYTGFSYVITVLFLVAPYFFIRTPIQALSVTLMIALGIIFIFNLYIARMKGRSFRRRFIKMVVLSLGIAFINFLIGTFVKNYFNLNL